MSSPMALAINIPFAMVTLAMMLIMLIRYNKNTMDKLFVVLCLLQLGWFATDTLRRFVYIPACERIIHLSFLLFLPFIPPVTLLLSTAFHQGRLVSHKKLWYPLLFAIPCITFILVLTSNHHTLLLGDFRVIEFYPYQTLAFTWGPWFWVHMGSSLIILAVAIVMVLRKYFSLPSVYRPVVMLLFVAIMVTVSASIPKALRILPQAFDPTILVSSISLVFFYVATISNHQIVFIGISREVIFQFITDFLIILDAHGFVADANNVANKWFAQQGIRLSGMKFDDILTRLTEMGAKVQAFDPDADDGVDIRLPGQPNDKVLNMRRHEMTDKNNRPIGAVVILYDVTHNRMLQQRLETTAGVDALTGLPNRHAYEGAKRRLSMQEYLPLTVVICDINNLKKANDTYGHEYGDRYIQSAATALDRCRPEDAFLARIGGDEFIYLLPHSDYNDGERLMACISATLLEKEFADNNVSIAMGAASRTEAAQDYDAIFSEADSNMYRHKQLTKNARQL